MDPVGAQPSLQCPQVLRIRTGVHRGHLVRPRGALDLDAVELLDARPALERTQDDHRPDRPRGAPAAAGRLLQLADLAVGLAERGAEAGVKLVPLDDQRMPAESLEQLGQLVIAHRVVDRGVGDLVAVDVEDRQHRTARHRIEELVRVPGASGRPGLRLAVADDAGDDQVRVVQRGAKRRCQRIPELAALVDRSGHHRREVAGKAAWPGEAANQSSEPFAIAAQLGLDVRQTAVDPQIRQVRRRPVAGPGDQQDAGGGVENQPIESGVDEVDARDGAPVSKQPMFDVIGLERLIQQVVVLQIDHRGGDVVRRSAVERELLHDFRRR